MKTVGTMLAAAIAFAASMPVQAAPLEPVPGYKASYDAKSDRYCIRTTAMAARTLLPTVIGKSCRSTEKWAEVGLTFHRLPAGQQVAQR